MPLLHDARYKGAFGGRGCVHPDTPIDVPGGQIAIKDFKGGLVWSWKDGQKVMDFATPASRFTVEQLYEVGFSDGRVIIVTDQHKFLTSRGWQELRHLCAVDAVVSLPPQSCAYRPLTTSGNGQQESPASVLHSTQTPASCLDDCFGYSRQYGQPLQLEASIGLAFVPLPDDAQQHNSRVLCHADVGGSVSIDSPLPVLSRPSSPSAPQGVGVQYYEAEGNCTAEISFELPLEFCQFSQQSQRKNNPPLQETQQAKPRLGCDNQLSLAKSLQTLFGKQGGGVDDVPLDSPPVGDFTLTNIAYVRNHSRQHYWDLHVFGTNNYLSNGIVNHNSGKSHLFAEMLIKKHIMNPSHRSVCVREVQKSLSQSVKRLLEIKIEQLGVASYFEVQEAVIKSKKGDGLIIFQGMQNHTADSIKSLEGYDLAWVEEAQSLSQRSLDLLRPTIRKPNSELWFTWNPSQATDPVDLLLRGEKAPPTAVVIEVNYKDNPWFPSVLKAEMEYDRGRDIDKYNHVWLGGYSQNSEARVFKNWTIEEFETPADAVHRFGADWGFSVDPTVLVRCHIVGRKLYIDHEAYQVGCEIMDTPSLFFSVPESEKWPIIADSARPETISHMRKNGFPKIMPAVKGKDSLHEGIEFIKTYDIVVHPRCAHTIDELTMYSYKTDPLTGAVTSVLGDKKNHVIDALRYACEAVRRVVDVQKPVHFIPQPVKHYW